MINRHKVLILFGVIGSLMVGFIANAQDDSAKFRLKPGAFGKLCQDCHTNFEEKLKKTYVHTPVKKGDCTGCHNPHSSNFKKLLSADSSKICSSCHKALLSANAKSNHKVVVEGNCMKCHDPHASAIKNNLLKGGTELCLECHKALKSAIAKAKFQHAPVTKDCTICHDPHMSVKEDFLLKDKVSALCSGCHKTDKAMFVKRHMNYPMANTHCTACHDPHGSSVQGILYNNVHKPVASKMCNQCHEDAASPNALKTKRQGGELCKGCHNDMYNSAFGKNKVHSPLFSKKGCLTCHNPHAGKEKGLLKEPMLIVCGKCHADTIQRQNKSVTKHEPVAAGNCTACHDPHSSNYQLLVKQGSVIDVCATCHDWMKHSTHPIGDKYKDPRNKNATLNCLSCHRSHGTEYKGLMPFNTVSELCVQCHEKFRR